jgi:hypothetical protein
MTRWRAVASLTFLTLLAGLLITGPAHAHAATITWRTCDPGTKHYIGPYRVFDNAWIGRSSRHFCVHSTGLNITIDSAAVPASGTVVAYPSIRFGAFWTDRDPSSGLPLPATRLGRLTVAAASTGTAAGVWESDIDAWWRPRADWTRHGTFEMVIVNRSSFPTPAGGPTMRVGRAWYRYSTWMTCQRLSSGACTPGIPPWRLLIFRRIRQADAVRMPLWKFTSWALRKGLLPRTAWLGDVAYGTELWSGGRGLTDSMQIAWPR